MDDVVILVHGTFAASESDQGRAWWQAGSEAWEELAQRLPEGVRLHDVGEVFHWSGENSERARIKAGSLLLARMSELEQQGQPYHVIGHSHGGSVIWHALRLARLQRKPLDELRTWATVGTPFMHHRTRGAWNPFNIICILLGVLLLRPAWNACREIVHLIGGGLLGIREAIYIPTEGPGGIQAVLRAPLLETLRLLGVPVHATEAGIQIGTFDPSSGDSMLQYLFLTREGWTLLLVVLAAAYLFVNLAAFFLGPVFESRRIRAEKRLEDNVMEMFKRDWLGLWSPADEAINGLRATLDLSMSFVHKLHPRERVLSSDFLMLVSRPYHWALIPVFNRLLRPWLDGVVRSFVIKTAQGNNRPAAEVIAVSPVPVAPPAADAYPSLPAPLNTKIVATADQHAGEMAPKLRQLLSETSFVTGLDAFGATLSGHELVHTSYFNHPEILDLLAMHIAWSRRDLGYFRRLDARKRYLVEWLIDAKSASGARLALDFQQEPPRTDSSRRLIQPRRRVA
jgi:hypothetical protein